MDTVLHRGMSWKKITESSRNHSLMKACLLQAYFQSAWLSSQGADRLSSVPACHVSRVSQGTQGDTETNAARDMKSAQKQVAEGNCLLFIPPVHFFLYLPPCSFCAFRTCCSLCLLVAGWLFPPHLVAWLSFTASLPLRVSLWSCQP